MARIGTCVECDKIRVVHRKRGTKLDICHPCFMREAWHDSKKGEICIKCGEERPVKVRTKDGPICQTCRRHEQALKSGIEMQRRGSYKKTFCPICKKRKPQKGLGSCIPCFCASRKLRSSAISMPT